MVAIISTGGKQWLRRSISAVLLLLFALSITPKKVLHDIIVNHQDDISYQLRSTPVIVKSGFHCNIENLVAESPFTETETVSLPLPVTDFIQYNEVPGIALHFVTAFHYTLRGPPLSA